jgi:dolichol-phosphate mannosyltransferase
MITPPQINIVIPLYNESKVFEELMNRILKLMDESELSIEVILVDDGSTDDTGLKMRFLSLSNDKIHSYFLSKNFGQQTAISAGLQHTTATEAVLIVDGDLQDPPELLTDFYAHFKEGYDVVYAVRKKRKESFMKVLLYKVFYRFLSNVSESDIFLDSGDFSLISMRVVKILNAMPEKGKFIRGMRSWVGFKQKGVEYERAERALGKSKYSTRKLLDLAFNGLFNFSDFPIKFIARFAILIIGISSTYFGYVVFKKFFLEGVPDGFTALLFMIILFGGIQLLAIGILGQYIIRVFFQVKNRPDFILEEKIVHSVSTKTT